MKVTWYRKAEKDRQQQIAYVGIRSPRAAIAIGDAIEAAVLQLSEMPHSGRRGRVFVTREFVVPRTPYVLVYRTYADRLVIVRLLHGAMRWPSRH